MIKLVILDVDGVLTDGTKITDVEGKSISKKFNDKDFVAIKKLQASGILVCFLSGDKNINEAVAKKRSIDFYHANTSTGHMNKKDFLPMLFEKYGSNKDTTVYVGDDYIDVPVINELFHTYCPSDSSNCVINIVKRMLIRKGGTGVVSELYDELVDEHLINECTFEQFLEVDKAEKEKRK